MLKFRACALRFLSLRFLALRLGLKVLLAHARHGLVLCHELAQAVPLPYESAFAFALPLALAQTALAPQASLPTWEASFSFALPSALPEEPVLAFAFAFVLFQL